MKTRTILSNGNNLEKEIADFDEYMGIQKTSRMSQEDRKIYAKVQKIKKELYGHLEIESMSSLFFEESARASMGIDTLIWDSYDPETKGKLLAVHSLKNKLDTIERFHSIKERENRNAS
jgi:hypothetical protein